MAKTIKDKIVEDMGQLYESRVCSDFVVQASDGQEFPVHRSVLAARSKVFAAMLTMENSKEVLTGRCEISDVDGSITELFLKYIYGIHKVGTVDSSEKALKLLYAAHKYDVSDLVQSCVEIIQATLNKGNATSVLLAADLLQLPSIKKLAFDIISKDRREFFRSGNFERVRNHSAELTEEVLKWVPNCGEAHAAHVYCPFRRECSNCRCTRFGFDTFVAYP